MDLIELVRVVGNNQQGVGNLGLEVVPFETELLYWF